MIKARMTCERRICQGDIIADVEHIEHVTRTGHFVDISTITFPLVMVLTQDCDLAQDYTVRWARKETPTHDKMLFSVLVAPLYNFEHVKAGTHLSELERSTQVIGKDVAKLLKSNQLARYHYIEFPQPINAVPSVIDFKHYFSVNVEYLKKLKAKNFVCKVAEVYREDICLRFANFLARIGLPDPPRPVAPPVTATTAT